MGGMWTWSVVSGVGIAVVCGVLSVPVVLKRLAFVGQGVSHAAFGGVGLAYVLGLTGVARAGMGSWEVAGEAAGMYGVVLVFCVASALAISAMHDRVSTRPDTAIGIVLAASMAVGFLLHARAGRLAWEAGRPAPPEIEEVLFGSVVGVGAVEGLAAWVCVVVGLGVLWWWRRPMLFWAFDEGVCGAFGVRGKWMERVLLVVIAAAIVVTMRVSGIVLTTAALVLPGATALRVSDRLGVVLVVSVVAAVAGVLGGLWATVALNSLAGPCIVLVLTGEYAAARCVSWWLGRGEQRRRGA